MTMLTIFKSPSYQAGDFLSSRELWFICFSKAKKNKQKKLFALRVYISSNETAVFIRLALCSVNITPVWGGVSWFKTNIYHLMMLRLKTEEKQGKSQIPHLRKQGKNMTLPRSHVRSWCVLTPPCAFDTSAQIHQGILWRQKYAALSCRQRKTKAIGRWSFYTKYCS